MTISGFHRRMATAAEHERRVIAELAARGWHADPFGQGQLPEHQRENLRQYLSEQGYPTPVRWLPDIIASKKHAGRSTVIYVDAKAGERWRETGNHDLEVDAVETALGWAMFSRSPSYFVFADATVLTPEDALEHGTPGTYRGSGSGTKFLLVPCALCRPFDAVFESPDAA